MVGLHPPVVGLHPSDPITVDVVSVRSEWHCLSMKYSLQKERSNTFLILYCNCIHVELIHKCHLVIETSSQSNVQACITDSDDVYYQVGRAAIASMLHNRYSQIKSCVLIDKQKLSIEISVLQKIST